MMWGIESSSICRLGELEEGKQFLNYVNLQNINDVITVDHQSIHVMTYRVIICYVTMTVIMIMPTQ